MNRAEHICKKMEGEIPIETDKIEGTDEEWKGFREFSEKVSRKLNGESLWRAELFS